VLTAKRFIEFVAEEISTSRCFEVEADDGEHWVVRAPWNSEMAKRAVNQFVAGTLATEYGLNAPRVELIDLGNVRHDLNRVGLESRSRIAVASRFIGGLASVLPPPEYDVLLPDFPAICHTHLMAIFDQQHNFRQFYGYRVFARWLLLQDDHKWTNLYVLPNRQPFFLDFDLALGGGDWNGLPARYDWDSMNFQAPFCQGGCLAEEGFEPWLRSLQEIDSEKTGRRIKSLPDDWGMPNGYPDRVVQLVVGSVNMFVDQFRYLLELKKEGIY